MVVALHAAATGAPEPRLRAGAQAPGGTITGSLRIEHLGKYGACALARKRQGVIITVMGYADKPRGPLPLNTQLRQRRGPVPIRCPFTSVCKHHGCTRVHCQHSSQAACLHALFEHDKRSATLASLRCYMEIDVGTAEIHRSPRCRARA